MLLQIGDNRSRRAKTLRKFSQGQMMPLFLLKHHTSPGGLSSSWKEPWGSPQVDMGWGILQHSSEDEAQQHCCIDCCLDIEGQNHRWGCFWRNQQWGSLTWLLYATYICAHRGRAAGMWWAWGQETALLEFLCCVHQSRNVVQLPNPLPPPLNIPGLSQVQNKRKLMI